MKTSIKRQKVWSLVLAAGLTCAALTSDLPAQERCGEVGINGMAVNFDGDSFVWPGFALNVGAWRKGYAIEGYALFLAYLPIAVGGSVIVSPFRTSGVIPYFSAGGLVSAALFGGGAVVILNAGVGLKVPFNDRSGIRAEYRLLYYQEDRSFWEKGSGITFGIYACFGRRTGTRPRL